MGNRTSSIMLLLPSPLVEVPLYPPVDPPLIAPRDPELHALMISVNALVDPALVDPPLPMIPMKPTKPMMPMDPLLYPPPVNLDQKPPEDLVQLKTRNGGWNVTGCICTCFLNTMATSYLKGKNNAKLHRLSLYSYVSAIDLYINSVLVFLSPTVLYEDNKL